MSGVQTVLLVLQLIPAIIGVLKAIEEAIPGTGKGEEKLTAVREVIEATYEGAKDVWPALEKVITILVNTFNKTGVFTKGG